jgi:hypothetical protein
MQLARGGLRACSAGVLTVQQDEQREHTRPCFKTGNNMIRGILDAIAGVVRIASSAEHHDASLFVLDYDVDRPAADVISPTGTTAVFRAQEIRRQTLESQAELASTVPAHHSRTNTG